MVRTRIIYRRIRRRSYYKCVSRTFSIIFHILEAFYLYSQTAQSLLRFTGSLEMKSMVQIRLKLNNSYEEVKNTNEGWQRTVDDVKQMKLE